MEEERALNEHGFHHLPPSGAVAATGGHLPVVPHVSPGVGVVPNAPILHRTRFGILCLSGFRSDSFTVITSFRTLSSPVPPSVAGIHVVAPPPLPPPSAISTPRIPVATVGSAAAAAVIRPPQVTPPGPSSASLAPREQRRSKDHNT